MSETATKTNIERLSPDDPSSYSRPDECFVSDLSLDLALDFKRKVVSGTGTYTCRKAKPGADVLVS